MRVYHHTLQLKWSTFGSLIICEGISPRNKKTELPLTFPHYMWGYIGLFIDNGRRTPVPSLYVRVYHAMYKQHGNDKSSLIICEGISIHFGMFWHTMPFPHYMWGYIIFISLITPVYAVPSLYVRVYHCPRWYVIIFRSSLIICEGISHTHLKKRCERWFPHYMWGYIDTIPFPFRWYLVPSLYVRVYRSI